MNQGLVTGLGSLATGLNPSGGVADNAVMPTQAANLGAIMGEDPDHIWSDMSALPVDSVGAQDFTNELGAPFYDRIASGLWNGDNHFSANCAGMYRSTDGFTLPAGEDLDIGLGSFAFMMVFRARTPGASNFTLASTRQVGDLQGLTLGVLTGTNRVYAQTDQGAVAGANCLVAGDIIKPEWQVAIVVIDRTAETLSVYAPHNNQTVSIAGHTTYTGANSFLQIGKAMANAGPLLGGLDIAYMASWSGAKAENLGQAELDAFWQPQLDNVLVEAVPKSVSDITDIGLPAPTHLWDFEVAAVPVPDLVGSDDLENVNSGGISYENATGLPNGELSIKRSTASTSSIQLASATPLDITTVGAVAVAMLIRVSAIGATNILVGKENTEGYGFRLNSSGRPWSVIRPASGSISTVAGDTQADMPINTWMVVLFVLDKRPAGELMKVMNHNSQAEVDIIATTDFTTPEQFGFDVSALAAANTEIAMMCTWEGDDVALLDASAALAIMTKSGAL